MYPLLKENILSRFSNFMVSAVASYKSSVDMGSLCIMDMASAANISPGFNSDVTGSIKKIFESGKDIPNKLNELSYENPGIAVHVYSLFPSRSDEGAVCIEQNYASRFNFVDTKPLLMDDSISTTIDDIRKMLSGYDTTDKLVENYIQELDKHRYTNYIINDICKSKYKDVYNFVYDIVGAMTKLYNKSVCSFMKFKSDAPLIDTLSISFYKLADVIPVFDTRCADGVAMEIMATNSLLSANELSTNKDSYVSVRLLFSKYSDNILTIDGEKIKRPFQCSVGEAMEQIIDNALKKNTPDDTVFKKTRSNKGGK